MFMLTVFDGLVDVVAAMAVDDGIAFDPVAASSPWVSVDKNGLGGGLSMVILIC